MFNRVGSAGEAEGLAVPGGIVETGVSVQAAVAMSSIARINVLFQTANAFVNAFLLRKVARASWGYAAIAGTSRLANGGR